MATKINFASYNDEKRWLGQKPFYTFGNFHDRAVLQYAIYILHIVEYSMNYFLTVYFQTYIILYDVLWNKKTESGMEAS